MSNFTEVAEAIDKTLFTIIPFTSYDKRIEIINHILSHPAALQSQPLEKPVMEKYGYHTQSGFDDEPTGWMIEGGEEAYYEALKKWEEANRLQSQQGSEAVMQPKDFLNKIWTNGNHTDHCLEDVYDAMIKYSKYLMQSAASSPVQSQGKTIEDIRNKLTPIKNLIAIVENPELMNNEKLINLLKDEIKQAKKSIIYLSDETNP